jgi:repressor LexA
MKALTRKQAIVFYWIKEYIKERRCSPSIRDIANAFHMSIRGAYDHVRALEKKGFVAHYPKMARTLRITYTEDGFKQDIVISAESPFEIAYEKIKTN